MDYNKINREDLIIELQKLQDEYNSLLITYKQELSQCNKTIADLMESELKFRTIADFTYSWECWQDTDLHFIYVSPSCQKISGYTPEEFLADNLLIRKILHPDDLKLYESHFIKYVLRKTMLTQRNLSLELLEKMALSFILVIYANPFLIVKGILTEGG